MLILTRRVGEAIIINDNIRIEIFEINKTQVKIGFDAPLDVIIHREEIHERISMEKTANSINKKSKEVKK